MSRQDTRISSLFGVKLEFLKKSIVSLLKNLFIPYRAIKKGGEQKLRRKKVKKKNMKLEAERK